MTMQRIGNKDECLSHLCRERLQARQIGDVQLHAAAHAPRLQRRRQRPRVGGGGARWRRAGRHECRRGRPRRRPGAADALPRQPLPQLRVQVER